MPEEIARLVYSTDKVVPRKNPQGEGLQTSSYPAQRKVTVRRERKGRGGKTVTVIEGLRMTRQDQAQLLKELKTMLGTGGTDKEASLEIQGDHRDSIIGILQKKGYQAKRSGG